MVTLFDAFRTATTSLKTAGDELAVAQMNLTNVGVPGYARQDILASADAFNPTQGLLGGASSSSASARSQYAEQAVWSQEGQKGFFDRFTQAANGTDVILGLTDPTGQSGIQGALTNLFSSFSKLSQGSSDPVNQQQVVASAKQLAQVVSDTAAFLQESKASAQSAIQTTVDQVNSIVKTIQQWNAQVNAGVTSPTAEAQVYANLERLSSLVPITVQKQANGGLDISMNGEVPLLQGTQQSALSISFAPPAPSSAFPNAPAEIHIVSAASGDVTSSVDKGELGGLLDYSNRFIPTLLGNANQQGDLNRLAQGIADSANNALGGSTPIFQYDPANAAQTLAVPASYSAGDLAATLSASPGAANNLAAISQGASPANQLDGQPYGQFLTLLGSRTAEDLNTAKDGSTLQASLLNQAQGLRDSVQGSSLEQSSVDLLQFQRAYESAAKVIGVVDELLQTTIAMVQ